MNIQDLGAIGEFVAAIATILTLAYLTYKIRQNTRQLRASSYQAYSQTGYNALNFTGVHAATLAEIGSAELTLEEMNPEQLTVFSASAFQMFNSMEETYLYWRSGVLDDDVYEARIRGYNHFVSTSPQLKLFLFR